MLLPCIFKVTCHTDHVGPNSTFVVLQGKTNGTQYIPLALQKGARTFVVDATEEKTFERICCCGTLKTNNCDTCKVQYNFVANARQELAQRAAESLNFPAKKLKLIAITGTKGKTTTAHLVHHIINSAGHKTALMGSIYNKIGTELFEQSLLTTPTADYLQMFLAQCVTEQVEFVVMEASSHAIDLGRIFGLEFEVVAFTNLGQDHLDYHQTMELYFATKMQLFTQLKPTGTAVINTYDSWGKKAFERCAQTKQEPLFTIINNSLEGLELELTKQKLSLTCPALFGTFNAENIAMAATICVQLGIEKQTIAQALITFPGVPGRLQKHRLQNGATAFVDFAHNPSSFKAVLSVLRPLTPHLIVIFGCGGNRDTTKRPLMGRIASEFADCVIVTDDNPRFEQSASIINDIVQGVLQGPELICESDRKHALAIAVAKSNKNSIIALLGKGHEGYFLIQGQKFEFDDFKQISCF